MNTYRQTHTAKRISSRLLNRLPSANKRPPRYKLFLLTWLAIYPLITVILHFLGKYLNLLPLPLRTLLLTGVLVYLMTYWVMPMLMKVFHSWLSLDAFTLHYNSRESLVERDMNKKL